MMGRVLTSTELQLLTYCGSERKAIELAKYITLPPNASFELIENSVAFVLINALEHANGKIEIEYCHGERRDNRRMQ